MLIKSVGGASPAQQTANRTDYSPASGKVLPGKGMQLGSVIMTFPLLSSLLGHLKQLKSASNTVIVAEGEEEEEEEEEAADRGVRRSLYGTRCLLKPFLPVINPLCSCV